MVGSAQAGIVTLGQFLEECGKEYEQAQTEKMNV